MAEANLQAHAPSAAPGRIVYCRCAFAKVVPEDVKDEVLRALAASGRPFDTVSDLCEMSARRDGALAKIAGTPGVTIAACYPRAVRGLFGAADAPLADDARILNMRTESAAQIVAVLVRGEPVATGTSKLAAARDHVEAAQDKGGTSA